jgi:DNA-binding transcriptional ArsR family regulator
MALSDVMKALSDPTRREILNLLKKSSLTASEIGAHFPISAPAISKHLSILLDAELVRCRREGKYLYYELCASVLEEVLLWLKDLKEEEE